MSPAPSKAPGEVGAAGYECLQWLLLREAGFVLEPHKDYLIETRLHALAQSQGLPSVSALLECLQTDQEKELLHRQVVEAMLNYETSFFRDFHPFQALADMLLPKLVELRASTRKLNFWCAAVASGQEAYSLAMLLAEHFPQLSGWNVSLLGSDISEAMLRRAREGVYSQIEVNRGLPARYLVKYFEACGNQWRLREPLRGMAEFSQMNLAAPWPPMPRMDLILLRNVLLYLSNDARASILNNVAGCLHPDGYLFVGGGETMLPSGHRFEPVRAGKAIYYRLRS